YGAMVGSAFGGELVDQELVPISRVANAPVRIESRTRKIDDGAGGLCEETVRFPVWFDPVARGGTPMTQALENIHRILQQWYDQHRDCFPPIVINITDAESTDGSPLAAAKAIRKLAGSDGAVLLFNLHLSSHQSKPITFPHSEDELPDAHARML